MITVKEKVALRGQAMSLKPALKVGRSGFTEGVQKQLDALLTQNQLVKLRLDLDDRKARAALGEEMAAATESVLVGATGKMVVLYRALPEAEEETEDLGE